MKERPTTLPTMTGDSGAQSAPRPEDMRSAMADYVQTVHQSYAALADLQPPAVRGRLPLLGGPFTVVAAGVRNLHVIATRETLAAPHGPEVATDGEVGPLSWTLRFYDPVVLPSLGIIDESAGPAGNQVRRALGISTYLYHLVVQPGGQLTAHHAGHAGTGLANAHLAEARDFEAIRAHARGREALVDEMEGAALAGLVRAHAMLAAQVAPWDETLQRLAADPSPDAATVRRTLLAAVRADDV